MHYSNKTLAMVSILILVLVSTSTAWAQDGGINLEEQQKLKMGFDVEVDPLAYIINGHSLHVGIWLDRVRLDIGAFGLDVPEVIHGQEGFESSFSGFGTKADLYFNDHRDGWFVGVEGSLVKVIISRPEQKLASSYTQVGVGARAGYRWIFVDKFYVEPWVGVGYALGAKDVELGGERFESNPLLIFPTLHLGYQIN